MTLLVPPQREPTVSTSTVDPVAPVPVATGSPSISQEDARHLRLHLYITGLQAILAKSPTDDLSARFADRYAQADMDARDARITSQSPPPV